MKIPQLITSGAKISIVSPAGKIAEKKILPAVQWIKNQGYKVQLGNNVFAHHYQYAGTDNQRLADLQAAMDDPETSAIICSRGGYGTVRILDQINFRQFKKYPKWLVGYSDITMLHSCINNMNLASIHGAMPPSFLNEKGEANENLQTVMNFLTGRYKPYSIPHNAYNKTGKCVGTITGGNLSIITSLLGTPYETNTSGRILFVEETDEYLYHIDRMFKHLKLAGKLENLTGLIIGDFTNTKDNKSPFGMKIEEIILDTVKNYDFPVCFGFPGGHDKKNLALGFGLNVELDVSSDKTTLNYIA